MAVPPFVAGAVLTAAQMNLGVYQVKTATASGTATTLQVDNAFSSDFRHYRIYISGYSATAGNLTLQLSTGGTAATTAYYWNQVLRDYGATPSNTVTSSSGSGSSIRLGLINNGSSLATSNLIVDVSDPFIAYTTGFAAVCNYNSSQGYHTVGTHYTGVSYDGFKLTGAGNLTLNVSVFGLIGA